MMKLVTPTRSQALPAIRAMKTVALADGVLDPQERRMIELALETHGFDQAVEALEPIDPAALAAALADPASRRELVQRLVILTTLDGEVTADELGLVEAYAAALDVDEPCVAVLRHLVEGRLARVVFSLVRRSFLGEVIRELWRQQGLRGVFATFRALLGLDAKLSARFEALRELPEDTLGNRLYHQYADNGFARPGQAGGVPSPMMFHDIGHVLSGLGTTAPEEMLVCAFQCGYLGRNYDLGLYLLIAMLFQLGVEPIARFRGVDPHKRLVDVDRFEAAYERGRAMQRSLLGWDPWPHMHRPVAEIRAELGVRYDGPCRPTPPS